LHADENIKTSKTSGLASGVLTYLNHKELAKKCGSTAQPALLLAH